MTMINTSPAYPFDCETALARPDWRNRLAWPRAISETNRSSRAAWSSFWDLVCTTEDLAHDCLLLAGGRIFAQTLAVAEAASVAQAALERGMRMEAQSPAGQYLLGSWAANTPPDTLASSPFKQPAEPTLVPLRMMLRTLLLSPVRTWPNALLSPRSVALSHNPLMHAYARSSNAAVAFHHAEAFLGRIRERAIEPDSGTLEVTARDAARIFVSDRDLSPQLESQVFSLVIPFIHQSLMQAGRDILACRTLGSLPEQVWIGGAGYYPTRLVAQEVRRRGGSVVGFEHGWGAPAEEVAAGLAFGELSLASEYVSYTPDSARRFADGPARKLVPGGNNIRFRHGAGDPQTRALLAKLAPQSSKPRPRVLYAPTILTGFRQMVPPLPPDPIHLDWQLRLCELLSDLPIVFSCRPHPEGLFRGRRHPLAAAGFSAPTTFEALMAETDVFLFDFQQSTTFGQALCTDRPIVLLDMGCNPFDESIRKLIRQRCRVVDIATDEQNVPILPAEAIRDAVLSAAADRPDPTPFRALIAGNAL